MPPNTMTPLEACDLFTAALRRILSAGITIRGINVNAVEFHAADQPPPPATPISPLTPTGPMPGTSEALPTPAVPPPATLAWCASTITGSPGSLGEVCVGCGGSNLRWSGSCKRCLDCGDSGGCG